ncbi:DUF3857 domain-containing protein [Labilibacter sediminis]|nr:DUF3857 domain-containing protein [Labilibacter sediminis]
MNLTYKAKNTLKITLSLIIVWISAHQIHAKESNEDKSGMNISKCSFEPDAPAVVIFDKGETRFVRTDNGFIIKHTRHKRVKIFDKSAFDQGEVVIPLYIGSDERENVRDIKGVTFYSEGGTIKQTHLDKKQIFEEPINKYWYQKKFALPQLKEGCVIEYSYSIESPFFFQLPDWDFQSTIPTIYSEYKVCMIPFYSYKYKAQGFSKFDVFNSSESRGLGRNFMGMEFNDMEYTFGLKNIPSFNDEVYISSKEDYIKKIDFQLAEINYPSGYTKKIMETWPKLAKDFLDYNEFGKYIKKTEKIGQKEFSHLINKTEKERVDAVLDYMKSNYKFNGYNSKYASKSLKEFKTEKTGNSANINLMAIGILKSLNIEAEPVLISTRSHGKVNESFPFADLFNYVIIHAKIDGKSKVLDATDAYCPNNMIPAKCSNGKGFIVVEGGEFWINIRNNAISYHSTTINYSLNDAENTITGNGHIKSTGNLSVRERKKFGDDISKISKELESKGLNLSDDVKIITDDKDDKNFNYTFSFEQSIEKIDDQIIFSPFFTLPEQENRFKQEKRELPIDIIYPQAESFQAIIEIPDGYKIEELPLPINRTTDKTSFTYKASVNDNKISITANYILKSATYPAKDYGKLKTLFNKVIQTMNQKILLTKEEEVVMNN